MITELKVGQLVRLATELEFWHDEDRACERSSRWDVARITATYPLDEDATYQNVDLEMIEGSAEGWSGNFDLEFDSIELV